MAGRKRRVGGEGSIYQAHTPDCPPEDANGDRPKHGCQGRWRGYVDLGWHDGKRDRRYVSGKTRRDVSNKLEKLKTEAAAGVRSDSTTVSEWMTYWLGHVAPRRCAESTLKTYRGYVDTWISPRIGSKRLSRLTPADVRELHAAMAGVGRAGATQRQVHSILRRALKVAVQDGKIPSNPAERVDSPENDGGHHAELTTSQSLAVLQAATGERERARVFVALLTGLRQGEALGLDWRDVDLDAGALRIRQVAQRVKGQGVKLLPASSRVPGRNGGWHSYPRSLRRSETGSECRAGSASSLGTGRCRPGPSWTTSSGSACASARECPRCRRMVRGHRQRRACKNSACQRSSWQTCSVTRTSRSRCPGTRGPTSKRSNARSRLYRHSWPSTAS